MVSVVEGGGGGGRVGNYLLINPTYGFSCIRMVEPYNSTLCGCSIAETAKLYPQPRPMKFSNTTS